MSRETSVFLMQKTDIKELFDFCNSLLGAENPKVSITENEAGYLSYRNEWGQGLPAVMSVLGHVSRDVNEEAYFDELYEEDYEECEDPEPTMLEPACAMTVSFDTGFGYRDEFGGADNLHGRYIIALYKWLAERGVSIKWREEYTREIHDGLDNIDRMIKNEAASVFFDSVVMPSVLNQMIGSSK